jgi:hypothetical protein
VAGGADRRGAETDGGRADSGSGATAPLTPGQATGWPARENRGEAVLSPAGRETLAGLLRHVVTALKTT